MNSDGLPPNERLAAWLQYFTDIGLGNFYRERAASQIAPPSQIRAQIAASPAKSRSDVAAPIAPSLAIAAAPKLPSIPATAAAIKPPVVPIAPQTSSLFEVVDRIANDTLEKIRADIGDCTRCRLCEQRTNIVFGDGTAKADLVFVGEGPGRDEDIQGLPFVGRSGKLLTQMIEAMGLSRQQVYICNVVKCRPPDNRTPEKDEVATCSPFLLRQLDVIKPKVIVCLGNCAAQALLATNRSLSSYRGQWLDFRGTKLMVTYHPAYLLRNPPAKADVWADLKKVIAELGLPMPKSPPKK
jgi:uracil-DNA glycosylase family 4